MTHKYTLDVVNLHSTSGTPILYNKETLIHTGDTHTDNDEPVAHWEIHTMNTIVFRVEIGHRNLNEASPSHLM